MPWPDAADRGLMGNLESLAQRGYTEGFLRRHVHDEYQNYQRGNSVSERQQFVGELTGARVEGLAEVKVKNRFAVGDHGTDDPAGQLSLRLESPARPPSTDHPVAPGDGHVVYLPIPEQVSGIRVADARHGIGAQAPDRSVMLRSGR